jgi:integrase/recombinase XerD
LVTEAKNGKPYDASSANRKIRTLRHCARWIHRHRAFAGGNPFTDVYEFATDEPDWKGLSRIERLRLLAAAERLLTLKSRGNQQPLRDHAIFLLLLHTGLRVSELVNLNLDQYTGKDLKNVRRKGRKETKRLPVPSDARTALDAYIEQERGHTPGPLFCSRTARRISRQQIDRVMKDIAGQANAKLPQEEHIQLHAHKLRHTALKTLTDKNGGDLRKVLRVSGHTGIKHLVRYVQATYDEVADSMENMYR